MMALSDGDNNQCRSCYQTPLARLRFGQHASCCLHSTELHVEVGGITGAAWGMALMSLRLGFAVVWGLSRLYLAAKSVRFRRASGLSLTESLLDSRCCGLQRQRHLKYNSDSESRPGAEEVKRSQCSTRTVLVNPL
jgi:hypothetical protein